jgi:hypothetical protein
MAPDHRKWIWNNELNKKLLNGNFPWPVLKEKYLEWFEKVLLS